MVLSTPRPRGRGKRRPERREGAAKRPRVESSSSDRRDGSEESRSGGGRDRPGRGSQPGRQTQYTAAPAHPCQRESTKEPAADQECGAGPTESSPYYKRRQKNGSFPVSLAGTSAGKAPDGRH